MIFKFVQIDEYFMVIYQMLRNFPFQKELNLDFIVISIDKKKSTS